MEAHQKVAKILTKIWQDKDFDLLAQNLADSVSWYEGSYSQPLQTPQEVVKQWKSDLSTQSGIVAPTKVMGVNGAEGYYHCCASWTEAQKGRRELDGIFLVRLDKKGKIKYFNSWWTEKPA